MYAPTLAFRRREGLVGGCMEHDPLAKNSFRCKLVTPSAALVDGAVTYASVPAWDGLMGFLPDRAPFMGKLGIGELRLDMADTEKGEGGSRSFLVDGGFVRMSGDVLTILAERAIPGEQITPTDAQAEAALAAQEKDAGKRAAANSRAAAMQRMARTRTAI